MLGAWQYDQQSAFQGIAVHFRFLAVFFAFFAFFDAFLVAEAATLPMFGRPAFAPRAVIR
jgi:hypothetical protein